MARLALLAVLAAGALCIAAALPACMPGEVHLGTSKIVLAAIGDWGRAGAMDSFYSPTTVKSCASSRQCCGGPDQDYGFPGDFDLTDADNAPQQEAAAELMNTICGQKGCQGVLSLGDTFYPCGADAPASGLNRFRSDWAEVYNKKTNLKHLPWYITVGNHDYGFDGSVERQLAFSQINENWVFPDRYYAKSFIGKDFSVQMMALDTTPFVQSYAYPEPNYAYFHNDYKTYSVPSYLNSEAQLNTSSGLCAQPANNASFISDFSDNATGQVPWLKSCLSNSSAYDWNMVINHFAMWGSDQEYANPDPSSKKYYPGMCGASASIGQLVAKYADVFINGHDHTMTHADPLHVGTATGSTKGIGNQTYTVAAKGAGTQYFTFGNGGSLAFGDGVTPAPKKYNNFSAVIYNNNYKQAPGEGFGIVTITKCEMTIDMYSYMYYAAQKKPVHTVVIPGNCAGKK